MTASIERGNGTAPFRGGRVQPLIHRLPGGADGLLEMGTFCAASGEVWKMHAPDALGLRHQDRDIVEHGPTLFWNTIRCG